MNPRDDPGFRYLESNDAEVHLRRLGIKSPGDRSTLLRQVLERYLRILLAGGVREKNLGLARKMLYHEAMSHLRARRRVTWYLEDRRSPNRRDGPQDYPDEPPEPDQERDTQDEQGWGAGGYAATQEFLAALRERLSLTARPGGDGELAAWRRGRAGPGPAARPGGEECPLHPRGCLQADTVLAIAQQLVNMMLNLLDRLDTASQGAPEGGYPREPRRSGTGPAGRFRRLYRLAALKVDPEQFGELPAGRKRRQRLLPCVVFRLWQEASELEHQAFARELAQELGEIYQQMLAGRGHRRARARMQRWLAQWCDKGR